MLLRNFKLLLIFVLFGGLLSCNSGSSNLTNNNNVNSESATGGGTLVGTAALIGKFNNSNIDTNANGTSSTSLNILNVGTATAVITGITAESGISITGKCSSANINVNESCVATVTVPYGSAGAGAVTVNYKSSGSSAAAASLKSYLSYYPSGNDYPLLAVVLESNNITSGLFPARSQMKILLLNSSAFPVIIESIILVSSTTNLPIPERVSNASNLISLRNCSFIGVGGNCNESFMMYPFANGSNLANNAGAFYVNITYSSNYHNGSKYKKMIKIPYDSSSLQSSSTSDYLYCLKSSSIKANESVLILANNYYPSNNYSGTYITGSLGSKSYLTVLQHDSNIVTYSYDLNGNSNALFSSSSNDIKKCPRRPVSLFLKSDGNVVGYDAANATSILTNNTTSKVSLLLQSSDGNLVVYANDTCSKTESGVVWAMNQLHCI